MIRQKAISERLLLGAIFIGLNLLCFLGIAHGRQVVNHTRVNYSHIPATSTRRAGSRSDHDGLVAGVEAYFDHSIVDHAPKIALSQSSVSKVVPAASTHVQPAVAAVTVVLARPEERTEPLAEENVIALGSAPRAPGLGRAPPIAA